MTCFWTRFANTFDPDCLPGALIYAKPLRAKHSYDYDQVPAPAFFSDAALTVPLSPTVAEITHLVAWNNSADLSGCTYDGWFSGSAPYVSPPAVGGTKIDEFDQSITFDPTSGAIPLGSLTGVTDPGGNFDFEGHNLFVMELTIVTDVGYCVLIVGSDYCY